MKRGREVGINLSSLKRLISPNKFKVLSLLQKEKTLNQLQIAKKINLSYRQTRRHIASLKTAGLIKCKRFPHKSGSPVMISWKRSSGNER